MLRSLGIVIGVAAVAAFATAAANSSLLVAMIGLACAACAVMLFVTAHNKADEVTCPPQSCAESTSPGEPASPGIDSPPRTPEIIAPASLDVASVAQALLASARIAGPAVRTTIWRADGASNEPIIVADVGAAPDAGHPGRDGVVTAIREGTTVLETLELGSEADNPSVRFRYVVPITFAKSAGAATVDFLGESPDMEALNRIAAAFRLPLAAGLALGLARSESEAAALLLDSARGLARILDPAQVVQVTLKRALELTGATSGSVMLYDDDGETLRIAAAVGVPAQVVRDTAVRPGDGIAGWVALSGQPLVVEDLPGRTNAIRSRGIRSAVSVPLVDQDGVLGVLNVGSREYPSAFTATDLSSLEALALQATVSLRNARAIASAGDIYFDTLKALSLALETKDPYALGGTERVMHYAVRLGSTMGLGPAEAQALEIAAMLHDIGMSSVGETAMVSQRPLSTVELGMLKMHPVIAAEILEQAPALREVAPIVFHHHERYDGTGYAGGISGEAIPLGARILAVADAFVAMTSDRPYRKAMSEEEAAAELCENAGTQFDPAVVDAFVSIVLAETNRVRESEH